MNITKKNILDTCKFDTIEIDGIKANRKLAYKV